MVELSQRIEEIKSDEKKAGLKAKAYLTGAFGGTLVAVSSCFYGVIYSESFYDNLLLNGSIIVAGWALEGLCLSGYDFNKNYSESLKEKHPLIFKDK